MSDSATLAPAGGGTWTSGTGTVTICNVEYLLLFDKAGCDGPCLTLRRDTGSGFADYVCVRDSCACNSATFSIGDPAVCTGTAVCGGPCANVARIRVAWAHCEYAGAGWYCVRACGSSGAGTAVELSVADASDTDIEILSGPYDTEEEAADCGAISAACCAAAATLLPLRWRLTFSGGTAGCVCYDGRSVDLNFLRSDPTNWYWGAYAGDPYILVCDGADAIDAVTLQATCVGGTVFRFTLTVAHSGATCVGSAHTLSVSTVDLACDAVRPFALAFGTGATAETACKICTGAGGSTQLTLTEV